MPSQTPPTIVNLVKTCPPQNSAELIDRQCLELLSETDESRKHILVLAPAGFGKTSLIVQYFDYLKANGNQVAWLSLSEEDADPVHFLSGVSYAIQTLGGNVGSASQSLIAAQFGVSYQVILTTLMNEIHASNEPITLFLDDLHRAESPEIETLMLELMENGPRNMRIIMSSRNLFPKFSRLQARNRLKEITADDLRVTYPEAEEILSHTYPRNLSGENILSLLERTDGWINGLQIAALSIDADTDIEEYIGRFSGRGKNFSEYIEHDIFSRLSDATKEFLIETSVLEILTPELCDVVTQREDSADVLAELQRMNLFLVTLDEEHECYRYHHIFRDFLKAKLSKGVSSDRQLVHRRAYKWCLKNNLLREAISHMLAVEDWDQAADSIEEHLETTLSTNQLPTLKNWICSLPTSYLDSRPFLQLGLGWVAILKRDFHSATEYLEKAESFYSSAKETGDISEELLTKMWADIEALKSVITVVSDNGTEIAALAARPEIEIPLEQRFFHDTYAAALVYALMYQAKFDEGHRRAIDTEMSAEKINFRALVYTHIFRGLGYRLAGQYAQAEQQYKQAQSVARQKFDDQLVPFGIPSALLSEIYYEWGNFSLALEHLGNSGGVQQESSVIEPLICFYRISARLTLAEGDLEGALQKLAEGEAVGKQGQYSRLTAAMLCERIRMLMLTEKLEPAAAAYGDLQALASSESITNSRTTASWSELQYYIDMGSCRYLLGTNKPEQALPLLQQQASCLKDQGRRRHLVEVLLIEARALSLLGKQGTVHNRLIEAIKLGARGGFTQTFLDTDTTLQGLIQATLKRWPNDSGTEEIADYLATLREKFDITDAPKEQYEAHIDLQDIDPLTPRELDLLRLLAKGLKNKELAGEMNVSPHTIAWHLKNLYSKLCVDNRTAAVTVAQSLGLK